MQFWARESSGRGGSAVAMRRSAAGISAAMTTPNISDTGPRRSGLLAAVVGVAGASKPHWQQAIVTSVGAGGQQPCSSAASAGPQARTAQVGRTAIRPDSSSAAASAEAGVRRGSLMAAETIPDWYGSFNAGPGGTVAHPPGWEDRGAQRGSPKVMTGHRSQLPERPEALRFDRNRAVATLQSAFDDQSTGADDHPAVVA
jgi:hypothetical protein